ncbi:uncharacterized protein BKA78DRAFT_293033 [Phyllosticta capitalensis]|uniref:uncharacterized protein n=1 Tax=Phyllosticta capitalensis TaxID=121624 RepID=UPI00313172F5
MELAESDNENGQAKKKLSYEQDEALRITMIKAELAKREQINAKLMKMIEEIMDHAKFIQEDMEENNKEFESLKKLLDEDKCSSIEQLGAVEGSLFRTSTGGKLADFEAEIALDLASESLEMALRLIKIEKKTRERMVLLAGLEDED